MAEQKQGPDLSPLAAGAGLAFDRIGPYRLLDRIGEGGVGAVYRAVDDRLRRQVSIKLLHAASSANSEIRNRFVLEAQAASALNHPNIVTVHDVGSESGTDYIVMEYVAGKTLREEIVPGGLGLAKSLAYGIQIAAALAAAHSAGIIHRDLKPGNIMVTGRGLIKVLDFGLAKLTQPLAEDQATLQKTLDGALRGTIPYMSPEQARGEEVDARSDIFSFGAVLYEMLTGRHPFPGETMTAVLSAILTRDPTRAGDVAPEVPPEIDALLASCLAKEPPARPAGIDQVQQALEQAAASHAPSLWTSVTGTARAIPTAKPRGRLFTRYLPLALGVLSLFAALVLRPRGDKGPRPQADIVLSRLTSDAGLTAYPALAPDGSMVAYASDRAGQGNLDIWVQQVAGGGAIRLTTDQADEYDPAYSPDGTRIVFRSDREGGGIYLIPALGGQATLLAPGGQNPQFSPDGSTIAYWTGREGNALAPGQADIWTLPVKGGQPRKIEHEFGAALHPIWTPDGRHLLYLGRAPGEPGRVWRHAWFIAPVDGGKSRMTRALNVLYGRKLGSPLWYYFIVPLAFSPDGEQVIFAARSGDSTNLWQAPFSVEKGDLTGEPSRLTRGTELEVHAAFARSSRSAPPMAFSGLSLAADIWTMPLDAENARPRGQLERVTNDRTYKTFPTYSARADRLAFTASRAGSWQVVVRDLREGKETVLGSSTYRWLQSRISDDGSKVAYWDVDDRKKAWLSLFSAGGGPATAVWENMGPATDVASDGSSLLFEPVSGPEHVMILDVKTGKRDVMVPAGKTANVLTGARRSPNGKWVAFQASVGYSRQKMTVLTPVRNGRGLGEEHWIPVTDFASQDTEAQWSPEGRLLYLLSGREGFRCVWARKVDPETGRMLGPAFPVLHFHGPGRSPRVLGDRHGVIGLSVTPGRMILAFGELTGNIWMSKPPSSQ